MYVRNLPFNATPTQLEDAFKSFGPIKLNELETSIEDFTFIGSFFFWYIHLLVVVQEENTLGLSAIG